MSTRLLIVALVTVALAGVLVGCGDNVVAPTDSGPDAAPPIAPVAVTATPTPDGVLITWQPSSQASLRGYNVYRLDRAADVIARLTATPLSSTSYLDRDAQYGVPYEYRVTAVNVKNIESAPAAVFVTRTVSLGSKEPGRVAP